MYLINRKHFAKTSVL